MKSFLFILLNKYCSGNKITLNEMGRSCGMCGEKRYTSGPLEGKLERKRHLGMTRRR